MRNYFCGWYFRCQSEFQTLAIIPSIHRTKESNFCSIQFITDTDALQVHFPYSDYHKHGNKFEIAGNRFGRNGIILDIQTPALSAKGSVGFSAFTPIRYDIMGPFRYVPFMQCRHSVFSMHHSINGELTVNGTPYLFTNAAGYIEGDRGRSFPKNYVWTQCSFPDGALMLSIADIPFYGFCFTGVIGVILLKGKEYRLATYLGAKLMKATKDEIIIRQGTFTLTVRPKDKLGHPLRAPVDGSMIRTIHEHPSCNMYYRFEKDGSLIFELHAHNAAFEYEL